MHESAAWLNEWGGHDADDPCRDRTVRRRRRLRGDPSGRHRAGGVRPHYPGDAAGAVAGQGRSVGRDDQAVVPLRRHRRGQQPSPTRSAPRVHRGGVRRHDALRGHALSRDGDARRHRRGLDRRDALRRAPELRRPDPGVLPTGQDAAAAEAVPRTARRARRLVPQRGRDRGLSATMMTDMQSLDQLRQAYRELALEWDAAHGDPPVANVLLRRHQRMAKRLRASAEGRAVVESLLADNSTVVRLAAATDSLAWECSDGVTVLEQIESEDDTMYAVDAKWTL